jgi:hypothetical protein
LKEPTVVQETRKRRQPSSNSTAPHNKVTGFSRPWCYKEALAKVDIYFIKKKTFGPLDLHKDGRGLDRHTANIMTNTVADNKTLFVIRFVDAK